MGRQLGFEFKGRGGKRRGAGRKPKGARAGVRHRRRPRITKHVPTHVTMRVRKEVWNLRTRRAFYRLWDAFVVASERLGARLIQFSVQRNHIHFIAEADSEQALGRAMKGLAVRIARALNRLMGRAGPVFEDRFHMRPLRTPLEVRRALVYVMNNDLHHGLGRGARDFDWFSSAPLFDGWRGGAPSWPNRYTGAPPVAPARSWLLTTGWRRHGELGRDERPA